MGVQYIVYRTVNAVNGKFYIGVHKDHGRNDSYLGSGRYLKAAVKKYGRSNFSRKTLASFGTAVEAFEEEKRLIASLIRDPLCMNVHEGGHGGFDYMLSHGLHRPWGEKSRQKAIARVKELAAAKDPEFTAKRTRGTKGSKWATNGREWMKLMPGEQAPAGWIAGSNGCRWVTDGASSKRIGPSEPVPDGWRLGVVRPEEKRRPKPKCGTYSCYVSGCRCPECTNANRIYANRLYHRRKEEREKTMTY